MTCRMDHWIDNADSYICPRCGFETDNPNRHGKRCPKCGFMDAKDICHFDLVEVVRCKDCVHYDRGRCLGNHDICTEEEYWFYVNPDDYCSHGERRVEDGREAN